MNAVEHYVAGCVHVVRDMDGDPEMLVTCAASHEFYVCACCDIPQAHACVRGCALHLCPVSSLFSFDLTNFTNTHCRLWS